MTTLTHSLIVFFFVFCSFGDSVLKRDVFHPTLLEKLEPLHEHQTISMLVYLKQQATFPSTRILNRHDRELDGHNVVDTLRSLSFQTQRPIIDSLLLLGVPTTNIRSFWICNMLEVNANKTIARFLANHSQVKRLEPNIPSTLSFIEEKQPRNENDELGNLIGASIPEVWNLGYEGEGFVVGIADTGVQWDHPALIQQYRGYDHETGSVDHNYNWWDAIHNANDNNRCGSNSQVPCDDYRHGTHVTGIAVGSDHQNMRIGVAPRAKWIGCRNMNSQWGTPSSYIECLQFLTAPTDLNGNNPDPSKRPHVIVNSYGCPAEEGCIDILVLQTAVENVVAAGIFMSVAAGNSGRSGCSTISDPPSFYEASFTVGALASDSVSLAPFSSKGPIRVDHSNRIKPNIAAPGTSVFSSVPQNSYLYMSGTSMATPMVGGAVALIYSANPNLARNTDEVIIILTNSTNPIHTVGCDSTSNYPNNLFGFGILNGLQAVNNALGR